MRCARGTRGVLMVALAAATLAAASCTSGAEGGGAVARVFGTDTLRVIVDGSRQQLSPGEEIPAGARVITGDDEARLAFPNGDVRLGPGAAARVSDHHVDVIHGEMLVASDGELSASWSETEAGGEAIYRLTPGATPRVAVYRGDVDLQRAGESVTVEGLREVSLSARRLGAARRPLNYRPDDQWDRKLMSGAIVFDGEAERLVRGLDQAYGTAPQRKSFYASFVPLASSTVPVLAAHAPTTRGDAFGPPSDALLTLFIARNAADDGQASSVADAVERVMALRRAGGRWGLVATEFGVTGQELEKAVDRAQARRVASRQDERGTQPPAASDGETRPEPAAEGRSTAAPEDGPRGGAQSGSRQGHASPQPVGSREPPAGRADAQGGSSPSAPPRDGTDPRRPPGGGGSGSASGSNVVGDTVENVLDAATDATDTATGALPS